MVIIIDAKPYDESVFYATLNTSGAEILRAYNEGKVIFLKYNDGLNWIPMSRYDGSKFVFEGIVNQQVRYISIAANAGAGQWTDVEGPTLLTETKYMYTVPPLDNILRNWYLLDPVNQKNLTTITGESGYLLDGYDFGLNDSTTVTLDENGLTIKNDGDTNVFVDQHLETYLPAGVYTGSVWAGNITTDGGNCVFYLGYSDGTYQSPQKIINANAVNEYTWNTTKPVSRFRILISTGSSVTLKAIKLEAGALGQQSLARNIGGGLQVIGPLPDKALELTKCQRYLLPFDTVRIRASRIQTGNINFFIPTAITMRAVPEIINPDYIKICNLGGTIQNGFTISVSGVSATGVSLTATKASHGLSDAVLAISGGTVYFDANL